MTLRAVLFDVDFTLCRPGPELSAERYARIAARHGLTLDVARYDEAREAAALNLKRHPELLHDDTIWHRFTEDIFLAMGGPQDVASECATEIEQGWEVAENFELYEDALPVLEELRAAGLRIGLVSNGIRDLAEFVAHQQLDVDPSDAVMVGDSIAEDVEGARALGMRALLVDREDRHPDVEERLTDLY